MQNKEFERPPLFQFKDLIALEDERILALISSFITPESKSYITRFLPSGTVDTSFGINGQIAYPKLELPVKKAAIKGVKILKRDQGHFWLIGEQDAEEGIVILQFTESGVLDRNFGEKGCISLSVGLGKEQPERIFMLPDGRLLIAGIIRNEAGGAGLGAQFPFVVFLDKQGRPNTSFGRGGSLIIEPLERQAEFYQIKGLTMDTKGNIFLGIRAGQNTFTILSLRKNGLINFPFGQGGWLSWEGQSPDPGNALIILPGNKILWYGTGNTGTSIPGMAALKKNKSLVLRFNPDGSLDPTFGKAGPGGLSPPNWPVEEGFIQSVIIDQDGVIWSLSRSNLSSQDTASDPAILFRLLSNGSIDLQWGKQGKQRLPEIEAPQFLLQRNETTLVVGSFFGLDLHEIKID